MPDDGLCLNVFLLLTDQEGSNRILFGQLDPNADWREIGGMTPTQILETSTKWMLPCRQLFVFESPEEASRSILKTQLELDPIPLEGPKVTSEAWQRQPSVGVGKHWDLSFLYQGVWPSRRPPVAKPWRTLGFLDTASVDPRSVGRSHLDVLDLAGYPTLPR